MIKFLLAAVLAALCSACGGGDPEPEPEDGHKPPPINCNADPRPTECL
ncbi:MAG: hypothetical protein KF788_08930 [Piscinibacter sp.]|nr:hypothetical protein [Piscinibacter sp.]